MNLNLLALLDRYCTCMHPYYQHYYVVGFILHQGLVQSTLEVSRRTQMVTTSNTPISTPLLVSQVTHCFMQILLDLLEVTKRQVGTSHTLTASVFNVSIYIFYNLHIYGCVFSRIDLESVVMFHIYLLFIHPLLNPIRKYHIVPLLPLHLPSLVPIPPLPLILPSLMYCLHPANQHYWVTPQPFYL